MDFKNKPKIKRVTARKIASPKKQADISDSKAIIQASERIQAVNLVKKADIAEKVVIDHTKKHIFERVGNLRDVKNLVFSWLFIVFVLLSAVAIAQYYGRENYSKEVFSDGGTYSEGIVGEINSLNPIFASTEPERAFSRLAFSRLTTIDSSGSLKNQLASSIVNDDKYENFTINMRDNVVWSDGDKLTADDVVFK